MSQVTITAEAKHEAQTIVKLSTGAIEVRNEKGEAVKNTKGALTLIAEAVKFEFDKTKINTRGLGSKLIQAINPKPAKAPKAKPEKAPESKLKAYHGFNHNNTLLGSYTSKKAANKDTKEYHAQTGNAAYFLPTAELDKDQRKQAEKHNKA